MPLPYDPDNPPLTPPPHADPMIWSLSRGLWLVRVLPDLVPVPSALRGDAGLAIATADTPENACTSCTHVVPARGSK